MSITLHTVDNGTVQAINDAKFYEQLTNTICGVVAGGVCTAAGGLIVHITAGWGIIQGRLFTIEADDITVSASSSGTKSGRLKLVIDLSSDPVIAFESEAASTLPALTQENLNSGGYVYEYALATYDVNELAVSNLVSNTTVSITPANSSNALMRTADIKAVSKVNSLPGTPDANTLYIIPE